MSYFKKFPLFRYDINKDGKRKIAVDMLKRVAFRENLKSELSNFHLYSIKDGETPEIVSYNFYGDSNLHWILLLLNEITNPYFTWPVSEESLENVMSKKYEGKAFYIKTPNLHFEKDMEVWVSSRSDNSTKREIRGRVKEWDATTRKLILYHTSGTFLVDDTILGIDSNNISVIGDIGRIVDIHKIGLHHFEDMQGNVLNPLATPPDIDGMQTLIGQDGITFSDSILHSYITGIDEDINTHKVVTFDDEERKLNDEKRQIKILKKELVEFVVDNLTGVLK